MEALDLAVEMARRIIGRELRCDPAAVRQGAAAALQAAGRGGRCACGSTRMAWRACAERSESLAEATAGAALELVADPALAPGDVVVETEAGRVDGRIASRLESFRAALAPEAATSPWASPTASAALDRAAPLRLTGRLTQLSGLALEAAMAGVKLGDLVEVDAPGAGPAGRGGRAA